MAASKKSKSNEQYFARYKSGNVFATNRKRKLEKLAKEQPNNEQIKLALKDIHYRRKTPKVAVWSHQMIAAAKLAKHFTGKFDKAMFSPDPMLQSAGAKARNENIFAQYKMPEFSQGSMFSLKQRAHTKDGVRAWI